ncbi:transposase [Ilyomonas limi]|uniref:Transposase n=1 Tax=Ilyomonas limi TaxID=2575867 RepID=A0A4U3KZ76_9BACT|nr:transposase [Ilyomonas limi]TKK68071.1 transposase [Ilyomonas limi]
MSYIKIWIHAVWGTKNRLPLLKEPVLSQVCKHILDNAKEKGIYINTINGYDEHLHILMLLKHDCSISKQMQLLNGESAFWINKNSVTKANFEWADKYFAASVSDDKIDKVRAYICNQQEHHKRYTFAEEYKLFLRGIGYENDLG